MAYRFITTLSRMNFETNRSAPIKLSAVRFGYRDEKGGIGDFPDVRKTPLHSLETDSSVRLASRGKPADNRSGIGINERHGIAVRRKPSIKMQRKPWGVELGHSLRHNTICDREGALEPDMTEDRTSV
jgi:hypothetical protein